jgi:drug/metabolite transporter (DMT)-like permease
MKFTFDKASYIGVIALLLWASTLPFAKQCSDHIGPYTTVAIAYSLSGLIGIVWSFSVRKKNPLRLEVVGNRLFALRVAMYICYFILLYSAIGMVALANYPIVILLNYLWPSFTLLFSLILFRQKVRTSILLLGTILIVVGISIEVLFSGVLGNQTEVSIQPLPYIFAFFAAFTWGLYSALNRRWSDTSTKGEEIPGIMLSIGIFFTLVAFFHRENLSFDSDVIIPLTYLSLVPFVSNVCWDIGTRKGNLNSLSLLADFIPWMSLTITAVYLKIPIGNATWTAAFLIVIGALISRYSLKVANS